MPVMNNYRMRRISIADFVSVWQSWRFLSVHFMCIQLRSHHWSILVICIGFWIVSCSSMMIWISIGLAIGLASTSSITPFKNIILSMSSVIFCDVSNMWWLICSYLVSGCWTSRYSIIQVKKLQSITKMATIKNMSGQLRKDSNNHLLLTILQKLNRYLVIVCGWRSMLLGWAWAKVKKILVRK